MSSVLPAAPGQIGTFEAAVLIATAGPLGQVDGLALALAFHAQQVLPQAPLGMMAMACSSRDVTSRTRSLDGGAAVEQ